MNELNQYNYLFLDRDGVINVERPNDYVKNIAEFIFVEDALKAIAILTQKFDRIFVVTNQRGIGRGIMTNSDLEIIHQYMISEIEKAGGRIDKIYYCTDLSNRSINRKPNVGMAFQAVADFPEVDFTKSVMVGNSFSDIQFGQKLSMHTILVGDKYKKEHKIHNNINAYYENLYMFADSL